MRKLLGVAVAAVLVLGGCSSSGGNDAKKDDGVIGDDWDTPPDSTEAPEAEGPEKSTTTTEAPSAGSSKDHAVDVGEAVTVGDWEVTVTEIIPNGTDQVVGFNQFNEPPSKGQYMLVKYRATYNGVEEGEMAFGLSATLSGSDNVQYSDMDCQADVGAYDAPTLEPGGSGETMACIDAPAEAMAGGAVFIEETMSFDSVRGYWLVP